MFQRKYSVKGEDVNDFMVMQNVAYLKYVSKLVDTFLFNKGFSDSKLISQKIGLQKNNDQIIQKKHLMFMQPFSVKLEFVGLNKNSNKMNIKVHFYNVNEELCSTVVRDFFWFDYASWKVIKPPKKIAEYFIEKEEFRKVG